MAIRVALHHKTSYHYDRPITLLPQVVRLRPAVHCRTPILAYSLKIQPETHFVNWQQDPYGNFLGRLVFPKPVHKFIVEVDLVADMTAINPFDFFVESWAEKIPFEYEPAQKEELTPYLAVEPAGPRLKALVEECRQKDVATNDFLVAINQRLQGMIRYLIRLEPGVQECEQTLELASGSCRDSAWLLVQVLRHLGLAARFTSGYLIQLRSDVKSLDGPSGPDSDFTDLHAWAEVYLPGAGWVGLDPTSGLLAGEGHIPLACAAHPLSAAPISGSFEFDKAHEDDECETKFDVEMHVGRIYEDPRVTLPYTEEQWAAIDALGHQIDVDLEAGDVRLTMGGEPTFVSADDRDGDEWNLSAVGPTKRLLAGELIQRMRKHFAPGGLLHYGQGKWYPGESLPRWALGCYWRKDGVPVWEDPELIADERKNYGHDVGTAQAFLNDLAKRLRIDASCAVPAYEDVWYYMWRERQLPINVDPLKSKLEDAEERSRLAKIFERKLGNIVGYAVPLRRAVGRHQPAWETGKWFLRRENMYLFPGDSAMGLRLPLDSLPWEVPAKRDQVIERDPFDPRSPLPAMPDYRRQIDGVAPLKEAAAVEDPLIRTALCLEPREGRLHIFMPPQRAVEDYLDLVAAIEATARSLKTPVVIEGYTPPNDPRLQVLKITPDPGVMEVNVHPASNWAELSKITSVLYDEAHQTRLSTEKFMLDGRHTGTGGGNHIVMGGPTAADSPILRRPDLLRSLLSYWLNHPSLSYLFSGLFVGPTSQAPRVDEARNDAIYELELAFQQLPAKGDAPPAPWLVDRVLRNLLADSTGNTHRTEFCIDKLFSPDAAGARLGLVEFRAFEMPPHARMSLVQQVLLRSLIARFWKEPYTAPVVRWGTSIHDRFMLPHYVMRDFADVLQEMRDFGYPLQDDWFAPHAEFRFPHVGAVTYRDVTLDLRTAIEPWHVLGEEAAGGGAVRYVDSSVERMQVLVSGMTDPRHVLSCNGRRVPLRPTGTNGEFVAGVRYRAWQPPSCLHPTIGVNSPLVFDLIDTWSKRSIGGAVYRVAHPGGRSHERFPVNAREAEGRRLARFQPFGHTPGTMAIPGDESRPECPLTLDLRQPPAVR